MSFVRLSVAFVLIGTFAAAQTPGSIGPVNPPFLDLKTDRPPMPIKYSEAQMPDEARQRGESGVCALTLAIDLKGNPQNIRLVRCTDPIFAQASLEAVRQYRFKPATKIKDNSAFVVSVGMEVNFRIGDLSKNVEPRPRLHLAFLEPQQPVSFAADSGGIYPLSQLFDAPNSFPKLNRFADVGFGHAAYMLDDGAGCILSLTIGEDGKPSDAQIAKCDSPSLEKHAADSLLKSQFTPAILNGKPVPVRASVHLVCTGFEPVTR